MKIGVDLRALQIGHQYRGIGEEVKQCLNRIFALAQNDEGSSAEFIFYEYDDKIDPKQFLDIPENLKYREVSLGKRPTPETVRTTKEKLNTKWHMWYGSPIPGAGASDVFLQFDYLLGVPRRPKTVLIANDLIPYIFWKDFFESPWIHIKHKAARTTLRTLLHNAEFLRLMKRSYRNANRILSISENTRKDLYSFLHVPMKKIQVVPLGASIKPAGTGGEASHVTNFPSKPFLLFIGGADKRRRRVEDLIAAYNNLKAQGHDIQLVLVGENFPSHEHIPNITVRKAVQDSSYGDDILTLGYVDDRAKQELYKKALAFVFPTIYEGFGIPILEAMLLGCPVITYKNSSIPEVGGKYAFYAHDWQDIWRQAEVLLSMPNHAREEWIAAAKKHADKFTWDNTARQIYDALKNPGS